MTITEEHWQYQEARARTWGDEPWSEMNTSRGMEVADGKFPDKLMKMTWKKASRGNKSLGLTRDK